MYLFVYLFVYREEGYCLRTRPVLCLVKPHGQYHCILHCTGERQGVRKRDEEEEARERAGDRSNEEDAGTFE